MPRSIQLLFPLITLISVALIWAGATQWIDKERAEVVREAERSTQHLFGVYEVQMVRALRDIDLTINVVRYACEHNGLKNALQDLDHNLLVPSALLFVVNIADQHGNVVDSNKTSNTTNVADQAHFRYFVDGKSRGDALYVGPTIIDPKTKLSRMQFARRITGRGGAFAGIVSVSIDP
ncbi:MAG: hypothetical protein V4532_15635, partial [Pseudomonadota bacterium]